MCVLYIPRSSYIFSFLGNSGLVYCGYLDGVDNRDIVAIKTCKGTKLLASVPGSLPYACAIFTYDLWTPRNEKSGREPGLFYHVSDVEGRENLIARGRPNAQTDCCPRVCPVARYSPVYSHVHSTSVPQSHFHYLQLLAPWPGGVYL